MRFIPVLILCGLFFSFECAAQGDRNYVLSVTSATGPPGGSAEVRILLDFPNGLNVTGLAYGVCASPGDGSIVDIPCAGGVSPNNDCLNNGFFELGADLAAVNGGDGPHYAVSPQVTDSPNAGWSIATVVNLLGSDTLPAQADAELLIVRYDLVGPSGSASELTFCEIGDPTVPLVVGLEAGGDVVPATSGGTITIESPTFVRGDVDGDAIFNGLLDGTYLLGSAFIPGSPAPLCMESADVNGNGIVEGLVDVLYALSCQFVPGSPCPPEPFPGCADDPDPESHLGCDAAPGCG